MSGGSNAKFALLVRVMLIEHMHPMKRLFNWLVQPAKNPATLGRVVADIRGVPDTMTHDLSNAARIFERVGTVGMGVTLTWTMAAHPQHLVDLGICMFILGMGKVGTLATAHYLDHVTDYLRHP